jgi:predicted RND superfamily exporter protein
MKSLFKRAARHPAAVFVVTLLLTVLSGYVVTSRMRMETNLDKYMPKDHPAFAYSDEA